jgi:endonuclease I
MNVATASRRAAVLLVPAVLGILIVKFTAVSTPLVSAEPPLSVAQAIDRQNTSATVRGYIVGQPTGTDTVLRQGFTADTSPTPAPSPTPGPSSTGAPPAAGYYAGAAGKTGPQLRRALHQIISTAVTELSYTQVWDALKVTDEDPGNPANVILLYSGRSQAKSTNGGGADQWNREHVWAKSHGDFGTAVGPGTDIHHLRPEDVSVNSERSNKDFDQGGSAVAEAPGNFTDADSWEPRNSVKGDVARMIFYMAVRYEGEDGAPDLEVDDAVGGGKAPRLGRLSVLQRWNSQDPPDAAEQRRNQLIYDRFQRNRNPFIDHPEWVSSIFG